MHEISQSLAEATLPPPNHLCLVNYCSRRGLPDAHDQALSFSHCCCLRGTLLDNEAGRLFHVPICCTPFHVMHENRSVFGT